MGKPAERFILGENKASGLFEIERYRQNGRVQRAVSQPTARVKEVLLHEYRECCVHGMNALSVSSLHEKKEGGRELDQTNKKKRQVGDMEERE